MHEAERYPFTSLDSTIGEAAFHPLVPLTLSYQDHSVVVSGLLDTGATVNVLPYQIGLALGATWDQLPTRVQLTGNLAGFEARGLLLTAVVGRFAPVRLAFAWTQADSVPLLLGQVNFFMEFDVCFYRSQLAFEVRPKRLAEAAKIKELL